MKVPKQKSISPVYNPRTPNQHQYYQCINDNRNQIIIGVGPAGTGKTLFACKYAVQELRKNSIDKIVITRPIVTVEEDIGYLPGNLKNKMEPWTRPLFDIMGEYYNQREISSMIANGVIEIAPLAFMRGRTFKNSVIIADEMQNSSPNQMLMMLTRIGTNTKLILTGDLKQSDRYEDNGLKDMLHKLRHYEGDKSNITLIEFDDGDIQRSPIVSKVLHIYDNKRTLPIPSIEQIEEQKNNTNPNNETKPKKESKNQPKKKESKKLPKKINGNDDAALIPFDQMR
jgi:phosphate starvation-inducible PhoH-like protein